MLITKFRRRRISLRLFHAFSIYVFDITICGKDNNFYSLKMLLKDAFLSLCLHKREVLIVKKQQQQQNKQTRELVVELVFFFSNLFITGWAESMLIRIAKNPRAVVFPNIEGIDSETFQVKCSQSLTYYGDFDWKSLMFNWVEIPQREFDRRGSEADSFR